MGKPLRGEVSIGLNGPVLMADVNALCEIMDATDLTLEGVVEEVEAGNLTLPRQRVYLAALLRHHMPHVTLWQAGQIQSEHYDDIGPAIVAAFDAMMPDPEPKKKGMRRPTPAPSTSQPSFAPSSPQASTPPASGG